MDQLLSNVCTTISICPSLAERLWFQETLQDCSKKVRTFDVIEEFGKPAMRCDSGIFWVNFSYLTKRKPHDLDGSILGSRINKLEGTGCFGSVRICMDK